MLQNKYNRRLNRIQEIVSNMEKEHGKKPNEKCTYYGGWSMGYYKGLLYAYEEILDDIRDCKEEKRRD